MRILSSIAALEEIGGPMALGIGVFDGVHLGHQKVIECTVAEARKCNGTAIIVTFDPHPVKILRPQNAPRLLTSTQHKLQLMAAMGVGHVLLVKFDHAFAAQEPEAFITALSASAHSLQVICVGEEWHFGKNRSGNVELLRRIGAQRHFAVSAVPSVEMEGQIVSSTLIREQIETGNLAAAARYMGRDYTILGTVVAGRQLGRQLGYPTANLSAHSEQFPPNGVYAITARLGGEPLRGVANIGLRPSIETAAAERLLEIHLFDFARDIYGQDLEVTFQKFLRPEQKFDSLELLKEQIRLDAEAARNSLAGG